MVGVPVEAKPLVVALSLLVVIHHRLGRDVIRCPYLLYRAAHRIGSQTADSKARRAREELGQTLLYALQHLAPLCPTAKAGDERIQIAA